jgi:hypothetical protein
MGVFMKREILIIFLVLCIGTSIPIVTARINQENDDIIAAGQVSGRDFSDDYFVQWEMNFGSDNRYGARYEGPQPFGDCDNDGENEMLVAGRDNKIRVFEWDDVRGTYLEMHTLFPPLYPIYDSDAGGFAIGDLDGDGENEIGATWGTSVHKFIRGGYKTIAYNPWIFENSGGSADCYIGDYDNDGENELIVSGGSNQQSTVPEILIYKLTFLGLVREAEWNNPSHSYTYTYMPGVGDTDEDGDNEIVCGSSGKVFVLDWDSDAEMFEETVIKTSTQGDYPFACIIRDSDGDGKNEIHVGYSSPMISVFEWDGEKYETKFEIEWPGEGALIEGLDVGDVDDDGHAEVCAGTDVIHVLQWDGETYVEEAVLSTFGILAVVSIGDFDNDGRKEIQAGSVIIDHGEDFMSWVFKHGLDRNEEKTARGAGSLRVTVKRAVIGKPLEDASVAAWNLDTGTWYDIQPDDDDKSVYQRQDLPEGEYTLRAFMEGYKTQETDITIIAGKETTYDFSLARRHARNYYVFENLIEKIINMFPNIVRLIQLMMRGGIK